MGTGGGSAGMSAAGRTYWLRGEPVLCLVFTPGRPAEPSSRLGGGTVTSPRSPRNCLVQHPDGRRVVRPFRGLRVQPPGRVS